MSIRGYFRLTPNRREYRVAFMRESDGTFEIVEHFKAADDDAANDYALNYYPSQEWYVLDDMSRNINSGAE